MYDIIIIGGGASGIMCALNASNLNKKILLLDADLYPAKKLMVTGNGKCNLTNLNCSSKNYNVNIDNFLKIFGVKQTLEFFKNLGLVYYADDEGRVYPFSNSAKSVIEVLNNKLNDSNIEVKTQTLVESVNKNGVFEVKTNNGIYSAKNVVVAVGGNKLQNILKPLKISSKDIMPSLVALMTENTKKLSGIRLSNVEVTAICGKDKKVEKGEVLFKDSGLSGIVVFNMSTLFARNKNFNGRVSINLMPEYSSEKVKRMIRQRVNKVNTINQLFSGWFAEPVSKEICKKSGIENLSISKISDKEIDKLVNNITSLTYTVNGCYDNNQVWSGGVALNDLTENLESKKCKGLYFCGEVCDVDGDCGGYNLQWAWTSGYMVGNCLK